MILSYNGPGLIVYGVAYYEYDPPYLCQYKVAPTTSEINLNDLNQNDAFTVPEFSDEPKPVECSFETVCETDDTNLISYSIDTESKFYI